MVPNIKDFVQSAQRLESTTPPMQISNSPQIKTEPEFRTKASSRRDKDKTIHLLMVLIRFIFPIFELKSMKYKYLFISL